MKTERLLKLARYLRALPAEARFDMKYWSLCALGTACNIAEFRDEGLTLVPEFFSGSLVPRLEFPITGCYVFGKQAACVLFGLTQDQAKHLFLGKSKNPRYMARKIEAVVRKEQREHSFVGKAARRIRKHGIRKLKRKEQAV